MDLCLELEVSMVNYSRIFSLKFVPNEKKSVLLGLSFSLDPVIQADTPIKQCCNFSRDSFTLETDKRYVTLSMIGIKMVVYVKTRDNSAEWCSGRIK